MAETRKYYWLKLKRDFFKRHDVRIIESLENGKDYLLFYLKLLVESIDHDGNLRFSDTIPYDEKMLSTITDTNIDIVRSACKVFSELGMMERQDDGTLFMAQVESMIGRETSDALRMREARASKQVIAPQEKPEQCSKTFEKRSPELEIEKELDKEKEQDAKHERAPEPPPAGYLSILLDEWAKLPAEVPKIQGIAQMSPQARDALEAVKGIHSDDVLQAIRNFGEVCRDPVTYWPTARPGFGAFFRSGLFERCHPANFPAACIREDRRALEEARNDADVQRRVAEAMKGLDA